VSPVGGVSALLGAVAEGATLAPPPQAVAPRSERARLAEPRLLFARAFMSASYTKKALRY
jgi:hypothetical protein